MKKYNRIFVKINKYQINTVVNYKILFFETFKKFYYIIRFRDIKSARLIVFYLVFSTSNIVNPKKLNVPRNLFFKSKL